MDDGSGKCLLDVINDPNALQEFLRSSQEKRTNSQMTVASQNVASRPLYGNHSVAGTVFNTRGTQGPIVEKTSLTDAVHTSSVSRTLMANLPTQSTVTSASMKHSGIIRTGGSGNCQTTGIGLVPSAVPISTGVLDTTNGNVTKAGFPAGAVSTLSTSVVPQVVGKPVVTSVSSFQGKKPIPIQPKTPKNSTAVNNPSTVAVQGSQLSGVTLINPGVPLVPQKQPAVGQQTISSVTPHVALNGVDSKGVVKTNVNAGNLSSPKSSAGIPQQSHSTTPVKRIAPKQPSILPQTVVTSSPQLMSTQHKVILPQVSHQITPQVQGTINQVSSGNIQQQNQTQLIHAQQLLNLIRNQSANVVGMPQTGQLGQSQPVPSNQIRQIQQLVQQKLSSQQQPQILQQVQQKMLSPASLQVALKQNQQLGTQNLQKSQSQGIVVQEEVVTQLLQQVQQQHQQQQQQKSVQNVIQQQLLQQLQQQQQRQLPKQVLLQNIRPQSVSQVQNNSTFQVKLSSQEKIPVPNLKTKAGVSATGVPIQQKQVHQNLMINQQQIKPSPQQKLMVTADQGPKQMHSVAFVQGQAIRTSSPQALQQAKPTLQHLKSMTTPSVQVVTTDQQTVISEMQQQQAQNVGVQKVFIIKQPELLQKLGLQGNKTQQTIQITPQQLQALKQIQLQQQAQQKLVTNNLQTGGNAQSKVLMADQLKQLQQQLQVAGVKQVAIQGRTQQPLLQQQRQVTIKTQPKMQHIPRILQTSGRQPVSQGVVKISVPIKQEPTKGVKRPHSAEAGEVPKVSSRLKQGLLQDQQAVLHPEITAPFSSHEDVVKRLAPYHVCYDPSLSASDVQKAEGLFSAVATQLVKRSQRMMERHRQLLFDESMREHPSAEMVMLYRVFLADERASLAQEKKLAKEQPMEIATFGKGETTAEEITSNQLSPVTKTSTKENTPSKYDPQTSKSAVSSRTVTSENDFVRSMTNTVSVASSNISFLLGTKTSPLPGNAVSTCAPQTGTCSSSLPLLSQTLTPCSSTSINKHSVSSSAQRITQQTAQLQSSSELKVDNSELESFDSPSHHGKDSSMEVETEKEDVTATLALLNSMASELDEVLDVEGGL